MAFFLKRLLRIPPHFLREDSLVFAGMDFVLGLDVSGADRLFEDTIDICTCKLAYIMPSPVSFVNAGKFMLSGCLTEKNVEINIRELVFPQTWIIVS